jgi:PAS domain S-box-containing protein
MTGALAEETWHAVLADHQMPHFSAVAALRCLQASGLDLPFIIVSGVLDEEAAVSALKAGAHDFMVKGKLSRLIPALQRELRDAQGRRQRRQVEADLAAAQARYRQWVEQIPAVTYEASLGGPGPLLFISPQVEALLGFSPQAWMAEGDLWEQRLHPEDRDRVLAEFARARKAGETFQAEYRLLRRDGTEVWVLDVARLLPRADGPPTVLGVLHDITEGKRAEGALRAKEAELRVMTEQLWQTARLATMGELAASVAHALNNPLAIVSLRVEQLAAQAAAGAPERQWLPAVEEAVERMRQLVAHLLQFSQRSTPQVSTFEVCDEVARTLELVHYQMRVRGIAVEVDCAAQVPPIRGDRQYLRQVFLNLFTNASDAMQSGGQLTVRVRPAAHNGLPAVAIEVADTGPGIAPEDLPRIWDTFYTTKPEGRGTGLGLAICRRFVHEHGGDIEVNSQIGQGTTVRVVLPSRAGFNSTQLKE